MRVVVAFIFWCGIANADTLQTGVDVRTDLGTHHTRLPIGYRSGAWEASIVLDPMYLLDGEHDFDVIGEYYFGPRIGVLAGWRWSEIDLADGHQQQQRTLVGLTGIGPEFFDHRLTTSASVELATLWVTHGGMDDAVWIASDRGLSDYFALGLFARIEYAFPL